MHYSVDHPNIPLPDWQTFRSLPGLIGQVLDRSQIELPDWFVPLARGVAFASDHLLHKAGYRRASDRPLGWRKVQVDVFIKRYVSGKDGTATLAVRQYAGQQWWTIERYRADSRYENVTDVLVFGFGSTPIFCWDHKPAMWLAEYCHTYEPPSGLRWIVAFPDDKDGAIEFARQRRIDEAS